MNIEDMDLSVRAYNCLHKAGVRTLEDITQKTEEEMLHIRNLGRYNLEEIKHKLIEFGVCLRDEESVKRFEFIKLQGKVNYIPSQDKWVLEGVDASEYDINNLLDGIDECLRGVDKDVLKERDEVTIIVKREFQ